MDAYEGDDDPNAVHKPTIDYLKDIDGAILPLPVRESELEEQQIEQYKKKKKEDKTAEQLEWELIAADTAAKAYNPNINPYEDMEWRNDWDIWYGDFDMSLCEEGDYSTTFGQKKGDKAGNKKRDEPEVADSKNCAQPEPEPKRRKGADCTSKRPRSFGQSSVKRPKGLLGRTIKVRQFDINICKCDYTYVFYGRRRSGKSFLMRWLLYKLRKQFPMGLCITKTKMNGYWQKYIPDAFVHGEMNEMVLKTFIKTQAARREQGDADPSYNPNAFLVLEDCVDQKFRFDTVVEQVFYLGRHVKVAAFIASQW